MPDQEGTLNNTQEGAGESSTPGHYSEELVPTVELRDASSEGTLKTEDPKGDGEKGGEAGEGKEAKEGDEAGTGEKKEGEGKEGDGQRFDQHPRFKELETQRNQNYERAVKAEAKAEALEARIAALEKGGKPDTEGAATPDYKDITQMSDDEITEWQESDPKGYAANILRQAKAELMTELGGSSLKPEDVKKTVQEILDGQSRETRINQTYTKFAEAHPDFNTMWDSGEIKTFMEQNPGHNAISAYHELKGEADVQKKIEEAVKKEREKVAAEFRAKRGAATLGDGPSGAATVSEVSPELKDPKKFGGATNVLVNRLRQFRQGRGA